MFGVLTMHLARLVNYGHSYEQAEDLFNLLSTYPLQHSFFHLFKPKRGKLPFPTPTSKELSNFYIVEYDNDKGVAVGRYHSKVGKDIHFEAHKTEGLKSTKKHRVGKKGDE